MAKEIEEKKKTLLDYIKAIIEMFRKPYYGAAMKALEDNLNTIGYNNAATAAVLDNLISVTSEIKGKLTGDMSEEKAQELMRELQEKIAAITGEMADMQNVIDVLSTDGVNGQTFSLYEKNGSYYLAQTDDTLIGKEAYLVDVATSSEGTKTAFTCKKVDVDPLDTVNYRKVELVEADKTHSQAIADEIVQHFLSDDEIRQQTANRELIKQLQQDIDQVITQSSESLFYEKDDGRHCSYVNKSGNFCVADRQQGIMFVFTQDKETNTLRAECFKCNSDLQTEGEKLFIAGEWSNYNDTIRFQRTENEAFNLSELYTFEATMQFLRNHNISEEQIAALKNDIVTPHTNTDTLTARGEHRIKSIYKALSNLSGVKNEGLNVELQTTAGNYLRFTDKDNRVTQVNFDKNGDVTNIEYKAAQAQDFKVIQQRTNGMVNYVAKPSKECDTVIGLLKQAQYSLANTKSPNKEKIKLAEKSSPALWEKASSDNFTDRIQAVRDSQVKGDILEHLAKDDNGYVRQAVASIATDKNIIASLAQDKQEVVRAEIAKRGLMANELVRDKSAVVRAEVARSGRCLDKLLVDPNEIVRATVASQGYGLNKLIKDRSETVRSAVRENLGISMELWEKITSEYPAVRAEAAAECRNNPAALNVLAEDVQKRVRVAVAENGGALEKLVNDRESEVRLAVAQQGYGYEILKNDMYMPIRAEIATHGYDIQNYVSDPSVEVRTLVAQQGYGLSELANDRSEDVRVAVACSANRREHTDILQAMINDPSPAVRIALAERGYGLDILVQDSNDNVRAAVAKTSEVYAEKLKDDKSAIVRNAAQSTIEPSKPASNKERE